MMRAAARLPLRASLINDNWPEERYATLVVARGHAGLNDESVPDEKIEYGLNGKPFFVAGPYDNAEMISEPLDQEA